MQAEACTWLDQNSLDLKSASPVLKERGAWMALNKGLTYTWDAEQRAPYAQKSIAFIDRITDTLSKKMVRKVENRWDDVIWPWDRSPR